MASIAGALERIKQDFEPFLPEAEIRAACREAGIPGGNASTAR